MKRGFPRPRVFIDKTHTHPSKGSYGRKWDKKSYPHPYNASDSNVAEIHEGRLKESIKFKVCGTCGEHIEEDLVGLIINNTRSPKVYKVYKDGAILNTESGPYHIKCLQLNFTMCPHLVELQTFIPAVASWDDIAPQLRELLAEIP